VDTIEHAGRCTDCGCLPEDCSCPHDCTPEGAGPVTLEGLRPGVAIIVARWADRERPRMTYRLRVSRAYGMGEGWAFVTGTLELMNGSPTMRKHPYDSRTAHLLLEGLTYAEPG
jgi:hypothetical protein